MVCPACKHANPAGAKFCVECGTRLNTAQAVMVEERKVVTVLFADLVGFTSRAEQMDPEDVRAFLSPYYAHLRRELEHFGGTVEKFIGDAVMALFGAPAVHEDDAERAVRAALAIRDWVRAEGHIQVRVAVNTGEALILLGARPVEGEAMAAGDVVNTAARLQSAAPVNGILVGERTFRATREVVQYRDAGPVAAKGKSHPIPVWEALEAVKAGSQAQPGKQTPLVGRERELKLLQGGLVRLRSERSPQLITVIGVPGIGKSRLLSELARIVEAEATSLTCLQGRSLPYDSAVSFEALAEMLKTHSGILETDSPVDADEKLTRTAAEVLPDGVEWIRRHLSVLVGGSRPGGAPMRDDGQEEKFAAWRGFFEALAERQPLVLMFEDLHWADDGLLNFLDYLVEWATDVPLLVVCSARPELLERRPGWGGGKANAVTLSLTPLSDEDTAGLIRLLAGRPLLEADRPAELLSRAGGNPLYAEQYAQMLVDHCPGAELSPPESIQAIIAARLDALPPREKRLVQDGAVVGRVFWPRAIAALGDSVDGMPQADDSGVAQLEEALHRLERKQFVRRDRDSSVGGQSQYAFLHILLRDVAYGQIPRATRIDKHLRAAGWFEALGRPDDQAQMLAHHYQSALDLAGAAGQDIADVAPRARDALRAAGDRAQALNGYDTAATFYRSALVLWPEKALAERTDLLFRLAVALSLGGDDGREQALETARAALLAAGDRTRAAVVETHMGELWFLRGERDECFRHVARADELVRDEPASPEKVDVLAARARHQMLADFDTESARQALELAEALGLDEQRAQLLVTIGSARWFSGDRGGREDIQRGLEIALTGDYPHAVRRAYVNLGGCAEQEGDLHEALRLSNEAGKVARRLGARDDVRWHDATVIELLFELGEWQRCAVAADEFLSESKGRARHYMDSWVRLTRARLRLAREELHGALVDQSTGLSAARMAKDPQVLYPALTVSAYLLADAGRLEEAGQLLDEFVTKEPCAIGELLVGTVIDLVLAADRLGRTVEVKQWVAASGESLWSRAARALLDHDFPRGLAALEDIGAIRSLNLARLWAARASIASGGNGDVDATLEPALHFFRSVGAKRFIRRAEALSGAPA